MSKNYLLIVEGRKTEKEIFKAIFERYGFDVLDCGQIDIKNGRKSLNFVEMGGEGDKVFLVQGPRNRIHDWLSYLDKEYDDFERYFQQLDDLFAGIFIIYDVDHTVNDDIEKMYEKYSNETDNGLLLLSSPCIEVISDINRKEDLKVERLTEYKKELNKKFNRENHCSAKEYIVENFDELVLYYLEKNTKESGLKNVMEHPSFVLSMINEKNERIYNSRDDQPVHYRYFTTVVYVCIAFIMGLTKQIENTDSVKVFFENEIKSRIENK